MPVRKDNEISCPKRFLINVCLCILTVRSLTSAIHFQHSVGQSGYPAPQHSVSHVFYRVFDTNVGIFVAE